MFYLVVGKIGDKIAFMIIFRVIITIKKGKSISIWILKKKKKHTLWGWIKFLKFCIEFIMLYLAFMQYTKELIFLSFKLKNV